MEELKKSHCRAQSKFQAANSSTDALPNALQTA